MSFGIYQKNITYIKRTVPKSKKKSQPSSIKNNPNIVIKDTYENLALNSTYKNLSSNPCTCPVDENKFTFE